ncbi:hypothetical protein V8D89_004177 [Ganoderma adspersum]
MDSLRLFPLSMRALSHVIYGRDDYRKIYPPSPIMQLSAEELSMIFQEVVHSDHTLSTLDPLAAVTLSHVCRLWRAIALSTSSLWAHISGIPHPAVSQYLSRSRNRPLSIRLEFNPLHTMSVGVALSVIKRAQRCKELHWIDESPGCVLNVSAFTRMARFPILEVLELASRTVVCPGECEPLDRLESPETELYPALRDLTLCQIHPAVLRPGLKAQLCKLTLKDLPTAGGFYISDLLYLLEECPHLETLELTRATPIIDVQSIVGRPCRSTQLLPAPYVWKPVLPIKHLVLNCVPTVDLWRVFQLLNTPALETLSHLVPSVLQEPRWPHIFSDRFSDEIPETPIEVPQLQRLDLEYDILDPGRPLAHLALLVFPNLSELRITYTHRAWDRDSDPSGAWFERATFPPSLFQPLFRQATFAALTTLHLAHASIDVPRMCEFLQRSAPVLELLGLENCVGAGALVCALGSPAAFDVCLHGHAHPLPPPPSSYEDEDMDEDEDVDEDEDDNEDADRRTITITTTTATPEWLGLRIHTLVLVDCADVRIDCLRKVIATRAAAELGVHDAKPRKSWSAWRLEEDEAVRGWTPRRIERLCVERCAMVTKGGMNMLRSLAGAPEFRTRDGRRYAST